MGGAWLGLGSGSSHVALVLCPTQLYVLAPDPVCHSSLQWLFCQGGHGASSRERWGVVESTEGGSADGCKGRDQAAPLCTAPSEHPAQDLERGDLNRRWSHGGWESPLEQAKPLSSQAARAPSQAHGKTVADRPHPQAGV